MLILFRVQIKKMWKTVGSVAAAGFWPTWRSAAAASPSAARPAETSPPPFSSLHTQMLFNLQLQISALLDRCRCRCSCRETRKQRPAHPAWYHPREGLQRHNICSEAVFCFTGLEDHTQDFNLSSTLGGPGEEFGGLTLQGHICSCDLM